MLNRVKLCRVLGYPGKCCTFGKIQIPYILVEILACSCLYTISSGTQVDSIQVVFKNHIFIIDLLFNLDRKKLLLEFSGKTFQPCRLVCPVGKNIIFQKLLCNGTGTFRKTSGADVFYESTENTSYINSVMFIETFVLNSHYCMLQIYRNLFNRDRKTIGTGSGQFAKLISVSVIQEGCIPQR